MNPHFLFDVVDTRVGPVTVVVNEQGAITELTTSDVSASYASDPAYYRDAQATARARAQLVEYADGKRTDFDLPLAPKGTEFQHKVWEQLMLIPYGETRSYGELAVALGNPKASRAVGRANATNPIGIIVPCHRVIGSSGELTGYAGGLPFKQRLLQLEGAIKPGLFD